MMFVNTAPLLRCNDLEQGFSTSVLSTSWVDKFCVGGVGAAMWIVGRVAASLASTR